MDRTRTTGPQATRLERTLSHLKIISRLLGHELHSQNAPRLSFSRDEVQEIQTSIDLFIEDALKNARGTPAALTREVEIPTVEARVN
jgi:ribosome-binding factor A